MAPINRAGPVVVGHLPELPMIGPDALRTAVAAGARVVDGRRRTAFAKGHIPGSLNIELTESFASYVGWFVPFGAAVVLVLPEPLGEAADEAAAQLFRIGYDRLMGVLEGGVDAWAAAGWLDRRVSGDHRGRRPGYGHDRGVAPTARRALPERVARRRDRTRCDRAVDRGPSNPGSTRCPATARSP